MKRIVVGLGILCVLAACLFMVLPAGQPVNQGPSLQKAIETVQADQTSAAPKVDRPPLTEVPMPSKTGPWPKVVAKEVVHSFGRMQVGAANTHAFTISNEGDASLELTTGNTTCKCTTFALGTRWLKPGESTQLEIHWKAGEKPDRAFRHGGDVHTNDPDRPVINYAVEGAIEMTFEVMPFEWSFGSLAADQTGKMKGVIMTRLYDKFDITSIESTSGKITVTPLPLTPEQKASDMSTAGYEIEMELAADIPTGDFNDVVTLKVSTQEAPIRIPVRAQKCGLIRLQQMGGLMFDPSSLKLNLGSFSSANGRPEVKLMMIVDQKDMTEEFQIIEKESEPSFIKVDMEPLGVPTGTVHRYVLSISVPAGRPHVQRTDNNPGFIRLKTNHPTGEVIALSVRLHSN